uniref:Hypothetical chloroplast RF1 n=1 Tax=Xylochloris irregularis TaxID=480381 RepID=A0A097KMG0_9CHLO|nr:hypothetical chloroplast RF1 [Xylochloris irregularis]AIT94355.1 hypothetical chloroplast RF1 [Xylochloris irregularis]
MSLLTYIKDYTETLQTTAVNDETTKQLVAFFLHYAWDNSREFFYYLFSLEWFRNVIFLPLQLPDNWVERLIDFTVQGTELIFVEASARGSNKFLTGFLNSFFLSLPFSCAHFIFLRRLFVQGLPAGIYAGLGLVGGQFLYFASILLGFRSILIPWLAFEPYNYFAGVFLVLWIVYDMVHQRSLAEIPRSQIPRLIRIFLLNFFLTWVEQSCFFQFVTNLTVMKEPAIFDMQAGATILQFYFTEFSYLLGLLAGSLFFTFAFSFGMFALFRYCARLYARSYARWRQQINYGFLVLIMATNLTSFGYHGADFLLASPVGFVSEDTALQKTVFDGLDLKDPYVNTASMGKRAEYNEPLQFSGFPFDRGLYLRPYTDWETGFEDLTFAGEHAWRTRAEFDSASWMERYKQRRGPTAIRNAVKKLLQTDLTPPPQTNFQRLQSENETVKQSELNFRPTRDDENLLFFKDRFLNLMKADSFSLKGEEEKLYENLLRRLSSKNYEEQVQKGFDPSFLTPTDEFQEKILKAVQTLRQQVKPSEKLSSEEKDQILGDFDNMLQVDREVFRVADDDFNPLLPKNLTIRQQFDDDEFDDDEFGESEIDLDDNEFDHLETYRYYNLGTRSFGENFFEKVRLKNLFKRFYYSNPVYQALLSFDVDAFLNRQPSRYRLTPTHDKMLFEKRQVLQQYYDSLWRCFSQEREDDYGVINLNTIPNLKTLKPYSIAGTSYSNRVYRQQFKGTLRTVRELFAITPDSTMHSLSYDQPLFIDQNKADPNISYHEELVDAELWKEASSDRILNRPLAERLPLLNETNPYPLYTGWDPELRTLVVTNLFKVQWLTDNFCISANPVQSEAIQSTALKTFSQNKRSSKLAFEQADLIPGWVSPQENKGKNMLTDPVEPRIRISFRSWPASYEKLFDWPKSKTKVETFYELRPDRAFYSGLYSPQKSPGYPDYEDFYGAYNLYNLEKYNEGALESLEEDEWDDDESCLHLNLDESYLDDPNYSEHYIDYSKNKSVSLNDPQHDNIQTFNGDNNENDDQTYRVSPQPLNSLNSWDFDTLPPNVAPVGDKKDENNLPPARGGGVTWRGNEPFPQRLKELFSRFFRINFA